MYAALIPLGLMITTIIAVAAFKIYRIHLVYNYSNHLIYTDWNAYKGLPTPKIMLSWRYFWVLTRKQMERQWVNPHVRQ